MRGFVHAERDTRPAAQAFGGGRAQKGESKYLRGTIALEMASGHDHFSDADKSLIKFHGSYQQDDRDARKDRRSEGAGKSYMFMVRCKIPGGKLTADQYLALDDLAEQYANGTLRITTRQGFQFHGVLKTNLKADRSPASTTPADHARRLRRRQPQRHGLPAPLAIAGRTRELQELADVARRAPRAAHAGVSRDLAQRRERARPRPRELRRGRRADLRQGLPAAQVQDRRSPCRTTTPSTLRPGPRLPGASSRTARSSATTCSSAAAWA